MKVAYLATYYPRVSHTFIRREIAALEQQGVEVARFCIRRAPDELVDEADKKELLRTRAIVDAGALRLLCAVLCCTLLRPLRFAVAMRLAFKLGLRSERGMLRNLAYLGEACILVGWLQGSGCIHVHAHFGTNSTTVAMLCHILGGPAYSFTAHGPEEFDKPLMLGLRDKIERARFVVAISNFARSQVYRWSDHAHWSKVHVVHCGLDETFLDATTTPISERAILVSVGRLNEQKGQLLLVEAAARLAVLGVAFELRLVGDGELRAEIEALIADHHLGERVRITGWADSQQVRAEMQAARVFVLPSFAEGLPVVLMEALAVGRPVLATYVGGIPELVTPECGWLVPPGSVEALVEAINQALCTPVAQLEQMGREGQVRVRKQHDARVEAAKLRALFERYTASA